MLKKLVVVAMCLIPSGVKAQDWDTRLLAEFFIAVCLESLPDFMATPDLVREFGFTAEGGDWGLHEFWHEGGLDIYGGFIASDTFTSGNRYCQVMTDLVERQPVHDVIGQHIAARWGDGDAVRQRDWDAATGWEIDIDGRTIEILVAPSMSDDDDMGVSLTVSEWL